MTDNMDKNLNKKKITIIGAGPAGLSAAYKILEGSCEFDIDIIEASFSVGGISRTETHGNNKIDLGGHRFFTKSREVEEFWKKVLPMQGAPSFDDIVLKRSIPLNPLGPDPEYQDQVLLHRNRVSRIYYGGHFFDYPLTFKLKTILDLGIIKTSVIILSYLYSCLFKRKENNLENFYINRFGKKLYRLFFEEYTQKLWGLHPRDISADWGEQRVKGLSIKKIILGLMFDWIKPSTNKETSLIDHFMYPKYGPGQLWSEVLSIAQKKGATIRFGTKLTRIDIQDNSVCCIYCTNDKGEDIRIDTDILISSMPLSELVQYIKRDEPENQLYQIAQGLKFRSFITVAVLISKLKLKNNSKIPTLSNIPPDCWIYVQDKGVKAGRIQLYNNWSPYLVADVLNTVWLGVEFFCDEGDSFWNKDDEKLKDQVRQELIKIGIIDEGCSILDYHCTRIPKAYPAYCGTYKDIDKIINYINGISNLYCIGRNGQHRYNNMDHSVLTAFRCADHILNRGLSKEDIWKVNTEKIYHESE